MDAAELDAHNLALGEDVLADGRVFFGTTRYEGAVAFRPAIVNWRTTERDVDLIARRAPRARDTSVADALTLDKSFRFRRSSGFTSARPISLRSPWGGAGCA